MITEVVVYPPSVGKGNYAVEVPAKYVFTTTLIGKVTWNSHAGAALLVNYVDGRGNLDVSI